MRTNDIFTATYSPGSDPLILERTIKALFAKSRNMCAFEGCRRMIVDETTNTVMGEIAHIGKKGSAPSV